MCVCKNMVIALCIASFIALAACPLFSQDQYYIVTIAGDGSRGYSGDGGPASLAALYWPIYLYICKDGSILFSDTGNFRIRMIHPNGIISTIAGNGESKVEWTDGTPAQQTPMQPLGIAVDSAGTIYFTEGNADRIRKIDRFGNVRTVAGTGQAGYSGDGGSVQTAKIDCPIGIFIDSKDNIFFADADNMRIRRISRDNTIDTVAWKSYRDVFLADVYIGAPNDLCFTVGSAVIVHDFSGKTKSIVGDPTVGRYHGDWRPVETSVLNTPQGVCMDSAGNVYVADTNNNCIRKIDRSGRITTIAGTGEKGFSGDGGPATSAMLNSPWGVRVDGDGNIIIADTGNHRIRKLSRTRD